MKNKYFVYAFIIMFTCLASYYAECSLKVNLIFENKTIMIYDCGAIGLKVGDRLIVGMGDEKKGEVEIIKVEKAYCIASIISEEKKIDYLDEVKIKKEEAKEKIKEEGKKVEEKKVEEDKDKKEDKKEKKKEDKKIKRETKIKRIKD